MKQPKDKNINIHFLTRLCEQQKAELTEENGKIFDNRHQNTITSEELLPSGVLYTTLQFTTIYEIPQNNWKTPRVPTLKEMDMLTTLIWSLHTVSYCHSALHIHIQVLAACQ